MISAQFTAITWSDIEALIAAGREEDDTIEFKAQFKGGSDYLNLNDKGKEQALDAIAREAIAFLNTRGGDIVIGMKEASGAHPRAEAISPLTNAQESVERLARGLAAVIEPSQTNISVRAILNPEDAAAGVIVIRTRASMRAPHRSKRTLEALVRRGTESVSMAMDEIQDLTMYRARIRQERQDLLDKQFADFQTGEPSQNNLGSRFFLIRAVFCPLAEQEISVDDKMLEALAFARAGFLDDSGARHENDVAFRRLTGSWRPILRGRMIENMDREKQADHTRIHYASMIAKESGMFIFDFASRVKQGDDYYIHAEWVTGYLAHVSASMRTIVSQNAYLLPGVARIGVHVNGPYKLVTGQREWERSNSVQPQVAFLPDFPVASADDLSSLFAQAQIDIMNVAGLDLSNPYILETAN